MAGRRKGHGATVSPPQEYEIDGVRVRLIRKRIRGVHMRLADAGKVVVISAPSTVSVREIERFVRQHKSWIDEQRKEASTSLMAQAEAATPEEVAAWREVVSACVPPLIAAWEPILGVKAGNVVYRNMKSRWGSCQPATGRICINVRLALYPPECLEYVVVHELCHLLERGHDSKFYALMDRLMPDWKERRAKLR
ncbi:SprT family zinc-dependent metalloprotease [Eggerthellaceae bacterium 3-80]